MTRPLVGIASWPKHGNSGRRLDWLTERGFDDLPSDREDVTDAQRDRLTEVATAMRAAGLYSKATPLDGVKWGIRVLVGTLRRRATA